MSTISEQTRIEQEAGRKALAENQAAYEAAVAARDAAEKAEAAARIPPEQAKADEEGMAEATAEAEALAVAQGKSRGFPRAKVPYQPNQKE